MKIKIENMNDDKKESNVLCLERDKITISNVFETPADKTKKAIPCSFRALGACTKQRNKWFVTLKKIIWLPRDKKENKKKHRVAIRMVVEAIRKLDEDLVVSCETRCQHDCGFNQMVRVINSNDFVDATDRLFIY